MKPDIIQVEDRCHRIDQQGSVLIQHLVLDNSVDSIIAHTTIDKQELIEAAIAAAPPPEVENPTLTDLQETPDDEEIPF